MFEKKKTNNTSLSGTLKISKSNIEFFKNHMVDINNIVWKIKKIEVFTDNLKDEST